MLKLAHKRFELEIWTAGSDAVYHLCCSRARVVSEIFV